MAKMNCEACGSDQLSKDTDSGKDYQLYMIDYECMHCGHTAQFHKRYMKDILRYDNYRAFGKHGIIHRQQRRTRAV